MTLMSRLLVTLSVVVSTVIAIAFTVRRRPQPDADDPIICPPVDCYLADLMVRTR